MSIVTALISKSALINNVKIVKNIAKKSKARIIAMVKSNAYGHDLNTVANILCDYIDIFAVARLYEAFKLRKNGVTKPIMLMQGFLHKDELKIAMNLDLDLVIVFF